MIESAGLSPEDVGATDSSAGTADAVIIGAGLAGLAAATTIAAARHSVVVLEASDGVGGRVRSDLVDGFVLDRGFQVLLTAYPELARHLDVGALDLCSFEPGADVWHDGRCAVVGDPFRRPRTLVATAAAPIGSVADKLRLGRLWLRLRRAEPRQLLRGADSTTAAELRRLGFSAAMIERFWRPLIAGVQLDPDLTTSRRMFDVILRCLLTGNSAVPAGGMGAISAQLADDSRPARSTSGSRWSRRPAGAPAAPTAGTGPAVPSSWPRKARSRPDCSICRPWRRDRSDVCTSRPSPHRPVRSGSSSAPTTATRSTPPS